MCAACAWHVEHPCCTLAYNFGVILMSSHAQVTRMRCWVRVLRPAWVPTNHPTRSLLPSKNLKLRWRPRKLRHGDLPRALWCPPARSRFGSGGGTGRLGERLPRLCSMSRTLRRTSGSACLHLEVYIALTFCSIFCEGVDWLDFIVLARFPRRRRYTFFCNFRLLHRYIGTSCITPSLRSRKKCALREN